MYNSPENDIVYSRSNGVSKNENTRDAIMSAKTAKIRYFFSHVVEDEVIYCVEL